LSRENRGKTGNYDYNYKNKTNVNEMNIRKKHPPKSKSEK